MTSFPLSSASSQSVRVVTAMTVAVCAAVIIVFAGLIPLGPWADEFYTIDQIRSHGFGFILTRLREWSPRPFSEMLVYVYGLSVLHWGRPLVSPALVPLWLLFWGAALLPSLLRGFAIVPPLVLGCLLLIGHNVSEVFYWPVAAFAYMPTLAAVVLMLTLDWASLADRPLGRAAVVIALLVAATSSEVGAMFSAAYCILAGGAALIGRDKAGVWLVVPLAVAAAVLLMLARGRASYGTEVFGDPAVAHHPWRALAAGVRSFLTQLFGSDTVNPSAQDLAISAGSKLLFFSGLYLSLPRFLGAPDRRRQWARLALAGALMGAALLTLVAAFNQFGVDCCLRHGTMRQGYILVAIAALATALAARKRVPSFGALGGIMLLASVVLPLIVTTPRLLSDYRNYRWFVEHRTALWNSAGRDDHTMIVPQIEPGQIVGGYTVPPGLYQTSQPNTPLYARWILDFFKKTEGRFGEIQSH